MLKNLNVSTYSDGTPIPKVTDSAAWVALTTGAYCYYNNDSAKYATTYGKLYNWYAVTGVWNEASKTNVTKRKKLAPAGYHIPTDAEWTTLSNVLGGDVIARGKMKEAGTTHWLSNNLAATNSSVFTGLPGGYRGFNGTFVNINSHGYWWSATEVNSIYAWYRNLYNNDVDGDFRSFTYKHFGYSVRCVRDSSSNTNVQLKDPPIKKNVKQK